MWLPCNIILLLLLIVIRSSAYSHADSTIYIQQLPPTGLLLDKGWTYMPGDNSQWANPGWDDSDWQTINLTNDIHDLPQLWKSEIGWFRLRFSLDSALQEESLALLIEQTGASEIYLNGRLIGKYGRFASEREGVQAASPPFGEFISLQPKGQPIQVLAVRFALQKNITYINWIGRYNRALVLKVMDMKTLTNHTRQNGIYLDYIKASIFFILALMHLILYYYAPAKKANFYFFVFALLSMLNWGPGVAILHSVDETAVKMYVLIGAFLLFITSYFFFSLASYSIFKQSKGVIFWTLTAVYVLSFPAFLWNYQYGWMVGIILFPIFSFMETARITLLANRKKNPGVKVVTYGALCFLVLYPLANAFIFGLLPDFPNGALSHIFFNVGVLSLPVSLSIYLATEASFTSRSLEAKLVEVQQLSEKTIFQEREKRHLQEMDAVKSRFFANLSHEFRTPLSLIRGTIEKLLRKDGPISERGADYQTIDRSADRLLRMINQLLDLSRLEAGKLQLHLQPGNVSELLKILAGSFVSLFASRGITFRYTVPLQPLWVQVDPEKLEQIVNNLLSNAAKFTPAKGEVHFTATVQQTDAHSCVLHVFVQDTGIGISTAHLPHIFERFYQADHSITRTYEGTGIGLALVKELVELHGGKIEAESTEGKGSLFSLQLPFTLATEAETDKKKRSVENTTLPTKIGETAQKKASEKHENHPQIVLVVEDNADLRHFIARYLSESYRIIEAENGLEGYQKALETTPDLIISDVMMPHLDGLSLCEKVKQDERTSHIPIILLTAKADTQSKLSGLEARADDYLTKPFHSQELLIRIHNLIEQRQQLREKFSRTLSIQPSEITIPSTEERFLLKILSIVEQNIANTAFDVETFSREAGMSRAQLTRKIRAVCGQSPNDLLRSMRLKRAAQLLSQNSGTIAEIAFKVGFNNPNYFTKCFRDQYGVAPSEYLPSASMSE